MLRRHGVPWFNSKSIQNCCRSQGETRRSRTAVGLMTGGIHEILMSAGLRKKRLFFYVCRGWSRSREDQEPSNSDREEWRGRETRRPWEWRIPECLNCSPLLYPRQYSEIRRSIVSPSRLGFFFSPRPSVRRDINPPLWLATLWQSPETSLSLAKDEKVRRKAHISTPIRRSSSLINRFLIPEEGSLFFPLRN